MTDEEKLHMIANYLAWTEDEFHLELDRVRRDIRLILEGAVR